MQTVQVGTTGRTTTQLGYGCSSLMGAMGRAGSLAVLEAAFDAGIRHFDVAPMYGYGQAEGVLGEFLARHRGLATRDEVTITTKYGIPPAKRQGLIGLARSVARPVVKAMPGLKRGLTSAAAKATSAGPKASFTATEARESLERSLRELKTDRIDIWLLHDATVADLHDEGLLRLMQDSVAAGKIRTFGVGSDRAAIEEIATSHPEYLPVVQFAWSVLETPVPATRSFRVHHRTLTDNFRNLHQQLLADKARCTRWSGLVGFGLADPQVLSALMLKAALLENPSGIVLFSSKRAEHIRNNVAVAQDASLDSPARRLYALIQSETAIASPWNERAAG
jgi:aryl-alcohol dehydrogenase-like predicted oxidoreductase